MKALVAGTIKRQAMWHWRNGRAAVLHRLTRRLLHDLLPTLIMFVLVAWGALIMTEHIYLAKLSRSVTLAEMSSSQGLIQKEAYIPGISLPLND